MPKAISITFDLAVATRPSAVFGGGFQNAGNFAPLAVGHQWYAVSGGDVGGHHISTDGIDWWPANAGATDRDQLRVSDVQGSRAVANRIWSYTSANDGAGGYLMRGVFDPAGVTVDWTVAATLTSAARAGNTGDNHPRQVARTMALDEPNDVAVLGTIDGLAVVTLSTGTVAYRALTGHHVTGVALDPADTQLCYCTVDDDGGANQAGVHRVVNIRSGTVSSARHSTLTNPQDIVLVSVGGVLYCYVAAMNQGIWRWPVGSDITAGWVDLTGSLNTTQGYAGVDAVGAATLGAVKLLASTAQTGVNAVDAGAYSTDGGTTWVRESVSWTTDTTVLGAGVAWWREEIEFTGLLDGNTYESACPRIDPSNAAVFHFHGRSGVWRSSDGGANWRPSVKGMCNTDPFSIAADPYNPTRVLAGDNDFTLFRSTDRLKLHADQEEPGGDSTRSVFHAAYTPAGAAVVATGVSETNTLGEVYLSTDPFGATPAWAAQGFQAAAGGGRARSVAIGVDGGAQQIILAVIDGAGIWRKVAAGTPTQVAATPTGSGEPFPMLAWPDGSSGRQYVYCAATTGLYRSSDHGQTWASIWSFTQVTGGRCGNLAFSPLDLNTLYLTVDDNGSNIGCYQITSAHATPTITRVGPAMDPPGQVAVNPATGIVYLCSTLTTPGGPKLYRSPTGTVTGSTVFMDITDVRWRSHGHFPAQLSCASDDTLYFASSSGGFMVRGS